MPESTETTIHVTIPIPSSRRESLANAAPQIIDEKESFAELTYGGGKKDDIDVPNEPTFAIESSPIEPCQEPMEPSIDSEPIELKNNSTVGAIEIDPTQQAVEKATGLRITGGIDFRMPITIFHVISFKLIMW